MANVTTITGNVVEVRLDGSTDWLWNSDLPSPIKDNPNGIFLKSIRFKPGASGDKMFISNLTTSGANIFTARAADVYDDRIQEMVSYILYAPVIDVSECTLGASADSRVYFDML